MSNVERLESHMIQLGLRFEAVGADTWVLFPETALRAPIGCKLEEPIVLFSVQLFEMSPDLRDREGLFRCLLELNSELFHSSYGLEDDRVVLSAAHAAGTLDFEEFQAMIDDMCMALDNHSEKLLPWAGDGRDAAANDEGST